MSQPTRRDILKAAAWLPLAMPLARMGSAAGAGAARPVTLVLSPATSGHRVSMSLASLSYETLQLTDPAFFSAHNHSLVEAFRRLNPQGVLRIGGNTSDSALWSGYHGRLPAMRARKYGPRHAFTVHPQALHTLAGFLRASGWRLVFGVNLRIGVPAMALDLARAVQRAVGDSLLAVQIGNEANNYEPDYAAFERAWLPYARVLRDAGLPLAGPDTGANTDWVLDYARGHGGENVFLSRHYYRDAAPKGSIRDMLAGDDAFYAEAAHIVEAGAGQALPFCLTEANSYYFGGRAGVSNVFASALWGADFMLALAQRGVEGIHFHGGTLASVEASLGRTAKAGGGRSLAQRRAAVSSRYAPIAGDLELGFQAQPLFHGMRFAQDFAGARFIDAQLQAPDINLTAYAAQREDALLVALINKDLHRDAAVSVQGLPGYRPDRLVRLTAASLHSRNGVRLDARPLAQVRSGARDGRMHLAVPRGSAAWVRLVRNA